MNKEMLIKLLEKALAVGIQVQCISLRRGPSLAVNEGYISVKVQQDIKDEMVLFLQSQENLKLLGEKMLNFGNYACRIDMAQLAEWLLSQTKENGAVKAVESLEKYLLLDEVPGYDVLFVSGIKIEETIELSNNIQLSPLSELDWLLPARIPDADGYSSTDGRFSQPEVALICPTFGGPKYYHEEATGQQRLYKSRMQELIDACWYLTLVGPSSPLPFEHTWRRDPSIPFSGQSGSASTSLSYEQGYYGYKTISGPENIAKAKEASLLFTSLSDELRDRIRIPLQRLNRAMRRSSIVDRCIELGIALESLFQPEGQEQISLQFRLRGAWFLGGQ